MTMHHVPESMTDEQILQFLHDHAILEPKPSRSLSVHLGAYDGASPEDVEQIAHGRMPSLNEGRPFKRVKIVVQPGASREGFDEIVIRDGNHRLAAAQQAGAIHVAALVMVEREGRESRWMKSLVRVNGGSLRKPNPTKQVSGRRSKDPQQRAIRALEQLLAMLRAGYMTYRTSHWVVHGDDYYANHLLLQRIYEGVEKQIDALGERMVGYYGPSSVDLKAQGALVAIWTNRFSREPDPMKASLMAAESIQQQIQRATAALGPDPDLEMLGIVELLAGFANDNDGHLYLLGQSIGLGSAQRKSPIAARNIAARLANP